MGVGVRIYCIILYYNSTLEGVIVSVPAMVSVGERDGMVRVCATLTIYQPVKRAFNVTLETRSDTGTE